MSVIRKKILYVITKSNWGGAQRYVFDLVSHLQKNKFSTQGGPSSGWDVSVALGGDGLLAQKLREYGTMIYHSEFLGRDIAFGKDIKSFLELYQLFKKVRPDVVHLNSSKAGGVGALAARMAGVQKIIFTAHGWPFLEKRNLLARASVWLFSWLTALLSHTIIVVSDYDLRVAKRMPFVGGKVVRIYNGIDQSMQFGSGEKIRTAFPPGTTITGTIGELTANKNQQALIEEARRDPALHVALVGEGEERTALEKKIQKYHLEKRVKLFGFVPTRDVLRGFDRFVLPSHKEGLPYVLLEARCAGLPLAANRVGGVGEALDKDLEEFSLEQMLQKTFILYRT